MTTQPLSDDDLHAYVDGVLDEARRIEVEALLARDPEAAAKVANWRAQALALHALFDPVLDETPTATMRTAADRLTVARVAANGDRRGAWGGGAALRLAAAVALVVTGSVGGWMGATWTGSRTAERPVRTAAVTPTPGPTPLQTFAAAAMRAHNFYTVDNPFMVELGADDRDRLDGWVSERLGKPVFGPSLEAAGYQLVGGRTLPTAYGPGGQYIYEDDQGHRITLFVGSPRSQAPDNAVTIYEQGDVTSAYWVEGPLAYALIGKIGRDRIKEISAKVHTTIIEEQSRRTQQRPSEPRDVRPVVQPPQVQPPSDDPKPKDM
ncbi:MAG: anti-sigma factor family protein [Rhodospirillales bacterium]|jgi:anti-sigma factor RsiW